MTIEQLKNQYAQEKGFSSWLDLSRKAIETKREMELEMDDFVIYCLKAKLEEAAERARIEHYYQSNHISRFIQTEPNIEIDGRTYIVNKDSIINTPLD